MNGVKGGAPGLTLMDLVQGAKGDQGPAREGAPTGAEAFHAVVEGAIRDAHGGHAEASPSFTTPHQDQAAGERAGLVAGNADDRPVVSERPTADHGARRKTSGQGNASGKRPRRTEAAVQRPETGREERHETAAVPADARASVHVGWELAADGDGGANALSSSANLEESTRDIDARPPHPDPLPPAWGEGTGGAMGEGVTMEPLDGGDQDASPDDDIGDVDGHAAALPSEDAVTLNSDAHAEPHEAYAVRWNEGVTTVWAAEHEVQPHRVDAQSAGAVGEELVAPADDGREVGRQAVAAVAWHAEREVPRQGSVAGGQGAVGEELVASADDGREVGRQAAAAVAWHGEREGSQPANVAGGPSDGAVSDEHGAPVQGARVERHEGTAVSWQAELEIPRHGQVARGQDEDANAPSLSVTAPRPEDLGVHPQDVAAGADRRGGELAPRAESAARRETFDVALPGQAADSPRTSLGLARHRETAGARPTDIGGGRQGEAFDARHAEQMGAPREQLGTPRRATAFVPPANVSSPSQVSSAKESSPGQVSSAKASSTEKASGTGAASGTEMASITGDGSRTGEEPIVREASGAGELSSIGKLSSGGEASKAGGTSSPRGTVASVGEKSNGGDERGRAPTEPAVARQPRFAVASHEDLAVPPQRNAPLPSLELPAFTQSDRHAAAPSDPLAPRSGERARVRGPASKTIVVADAPTPPPAAPATERAPVIEGRPHVAAPSVARPSIAAEARVATADDRRDATATEPRPASAGPARPAANAETAPKTATATGTAFATQPVPSSAHPAAAPTIVRAAAATDVSGAPPAKTPDLHSHAPHIQRRATDERRPSERPAAEAPQTTATAVPRTPPAPQAFAAAPSVAQVFAPSFTAPAAPARPGVIKASGPAAAHAPVVAAPAAAAPSLPARPSSPGVASAPAALPAPARVAVPASPLARQFVVGKDAPSPAVAPTPPPLPPITSGLHAPTAPAARATAPAPVSPAVGSVPALSVAPSAGSPRHAHASPPATPAAPHVAHASKRTDAVPASITTAHQPAETPAKTAPVVPAPVATAPVATAPVVPAPVATGPVATAPVAAAPAAPVATAAAPAVPPVAATAPSRTPSISSLHPAPVRAQTRTSASLPAHPMSPAVAPMSRSVPTVPELSAALEPRRVRAAVLELQHRVSGASDVATADSRMVVDTAGGADKGRREKKAAPPRSSHATDGVATAQVVRDVAFASVVPAAAATSSSTAEAATAASRDEDRPRASTTRPRSAAGSSVERTTVSPEAIGRHMTAPVPFLPGSSAAATGLVAAAPATGQGLAEAPSTPVSAAAATSRARAASAVAADGQPSSTGPERSKDNGPRPTEAATFAVAPRPRTPAEPVHAGTSAQQPLVLRSDGVPMTFAPSAAAPLLDLAADDPTLHAAALGKTAHVRLDTGAAGDLALHMVVKDGVVDLRVDGSAAQTLDIRQNEVRTALAGEGIALGRFEAGGPSSGQASGQSFSSQGGAFRDGSADQSQRGSQAAASSAPSSSSPRDATFSDAAATQTSGGQPQSPGNWGGGSRHFSGQDQNDARWADRDAPASPRSTPGTSPASAGTAATNAHPRRGVHVTA